MSQTMFKTSETFSSEEVAELSGVTARQLQWWDEKGVVSPQHQGHRRRYRLEELLEVSVISELRQKGFSLQKIRKVLRFLQRELGRRLRSEEHTSELQSQSNLVCRLLLEKKKKKIKLYNSIKKKKNKKNKN